MTQSQHFRLLVPILLSLGLVSFTRAEAPRDSWPVPRGPSREPVPYRYDANPQLPRRFLDDVPACTLYAGITHLVESDGTVETVTHDITRFNGRKGIERLGEYRGISYTPSYQSLSLNLARVYKASGAVVAIEPKHLQLRDLGTDYLVYDHDKQLIISFPSLEVGDAIEVKWTTRGKNPEHQGHFFTRYNFGDDRYPVAVDEMRVCLPKERNLKYAASGDALEPVVSEKGDTRIYHWRATNRNELPRDENLPPKEELRLAVDCSTFASWEEVGRWKTRIRENSWKCTPEIRQIVNEVAKDLKTPLEKARALTYWVRRHIRYVSVGETHEYTPHAPALVLANRFGDCKDQSQLLAVMLHEAGVPVALATLGTVDDGQVLEAVPSPWGTHAILLVTLDGKDHWIDTTVSLAAWDYLPRDDRGRLCYVVDGKGIRLLRTPSLTPENNRIEQTTRLSVAADGSSRNERRCVYHGAAALAQREAWVEVPPGERRRVAASDLQNSQGRARLSRLDIDDKKLRDFDQPVSAQITFEVPGHFAGEADREGSITDSPTWAKLLSINLDYDRQTPLDLLEPFESLHRYSIHLPPGFRFESPPKEQDVRSAWGSFVLKVRNDPEKPRQLDVEIRFHLDKTRVEPADFDAFRKFHENVFKNYRVWLTIKQTGDAEDAPALEAILALAPGDSAAAAVLARLYQKEGKDARRVLQRARHYNPSDIALLELSLALAENAEETEAAYQELMRRAPEEPRYQIALGESRVNRGDHAGAKEVLEQIVLKGPASASGQAHYQLARSYFMQKQPAEALKQLEEAAKADPESVVSAPALIFKAQVHGKLNQLTEANLSYVKALGKDPVNEESLRALIQLNIGSQQAALRYLRRYSTLVDVDGSLDMAKSAAIWVKSAEFYYDLKFYDDAFDFAIRARDIEGAIRTLENKPDYQSGFQRILGLLYLKRGNWEQAVEHLEKAELDAQVLEGLIEGNLRLGRLKEARAQAERIDKITTSPASLRQAYERTLALAKRRLEVGQGLRIPPETKEEWNKAIDAFLCAEHLLNSGGAPERVEALLAASFTKGVELGQASALRGLLALEKGRLSLALADAEKALTLCPREGRAYYVRGRVRLECDKEGALADLSRAAELSHRKDANQLHWLAAALFRAGARAEALAAQREAHQLKPQDEEIKEPLLRWEKDRGKAKNEESR